MTTCLKCEYTRLPTDTAPDYECPRCGIIYAKFRAAGEVLPDVSAPPVEGGRGWGRNVMWVVVAIAVVGGGAYGYAWKQEQNAIAATRQSMGELKEVAEKFFAAARLASSTSRIALAGPVKDLQGIAREVEAIKPVGCAKPAHAALKQATRSAVDGFLAFMGKDSSAVEFDTLSENLRLFHEQTALCIDTLRPDRSGAM